MSARRIILMLERAIAEERESGRPEAQGDPFCTEASAEYDEGFLAGMERSLTIALLVAAVPREPCEICGSSMERKRQDARWCSSACRYVAHRKNNPRRVSHSRVNVTQAREMRESGMSLREIQPLPELPLPLRSLQAGERHALQCAVSLDTGGNDRVHWLPPQVPAGRAGGGDPPKKGEAT